jgi:UDP-N-acetylglucosamine 4,6-dehydratase/5-epimerase
MSIIEGKAVLVTGATGSFGKRFIERVLERHHPKRLVVFSRDELKQFEMKDRFHAPHLEYMLGDVRDKERIYRAIDGIDVVIHAAAMKQVPSSEHNPMEAIKTNIIGAENVINACIEQKVERVIAMSTDKAANPINLYGATKLCSDKLFTAANNLDRKHRTHFSVVRYGNVVGSRGSVIPFFIQRRETGVIPITDIRMTRFWITLSQGVEFVLNCLERMRGGELFVPKIPSMKITDVAQAVAPDCRTEIIGIRPGEKLHEVMVTRDDATHTLEFEDHFVVQPSAEWWNKEDYRQTTGGRPVADDFQYSSDNNTKWLSREQLQDLLKREAIEL